LFIYFMIEIDNSLVVKICWLEAKQSVTLLAIRSLAYIFALPFY